MINTNLSPVNPETVCQLKLVDGSLMPQAAMGTFHSDNPDLMKGMKDIVVEAIRLGYRHIDCATAYQNEEIVGQAICLLYTSPSPRDRTRSRMPSSA